MSVSTALVLSDFEAEDEGEISLPQGVIVKILRRDEDGWWTVDYNGNTGLFPGGFLQICEPEHPKDEDPEQNKVQATPSVRGGTQQRGRPLPVPNQHPQHSQTPQNSQSPQNPRGRGSFRGPSAARGRPNPNDSTMTKNPPPTTQQPNSQRSLPARPNAPNRGGSNRPRGNMNQSHPQPENIRGRGAPRRARGVGSLPSTGRDLNSKGTNNSPPNPQNQTNQQLESNKDNNPTNNNHNDAEQEENEEERLLHRQKVIEELINTEKDYVHDLEIVVKVFVQPLQTMNIVPREELAILFSNIDVILSVNKQLELLLLNGSEDPRNLMIGSIFLDIAEVFKMYTAYCSNQPTSLAALDALQKVPAFDAFLQECLQNELCRGLTLFSFLIKPIQRICKYPLLLRDLLKHTSKDHRDYENLQNALLKIEKVVEYVNDRKRLAENLQKILDVQNQIESNEELRLVEPTRRFVREGTLKVIEKGHTRERKTFVFNDLIVLTKPKRSMMGNVVKDHFKAQFHLNEIKIVDVADIGDKKNVCEVCPKESAEDRTKFSFLFVFNSPEEKTEWTKEIKNLIREFQKKEAQARKEALDKRAEEEAKGIFSTPEPSKPINESDQEKEQSGTKISRRIKKKETSNSSSTMRNKSLPTIKSTPSNPSNSPGYQRPAPPGNTRAITGRSVQPQKTSSTPTMLKKFLTRDSNANNRTCSSKELSRKLANAVNAAQ